MQRHSLIGRYKVESMLGEGAMGSVFKAFDPLLQRMVAIKTIKPDSSRNASEIEEFHKRFIQEAQISGILLHPNIVSVFDIGVHEDMPFIAMEFVEGLTLGDLIRRTTPSPTYGEIIQILMQISAALDFAHTKGIVHRDLKPGNIMVMPNGTAKIMDFGIAKRSDSTLTQTGVFLGTPSYSSPEQIRVGHVDARSDIFSFGILSHEALTGQLPFPGNNINMILYKIAHEPPELATNLDSMPVDVVAWRESFNKVLHKDPVQRFPTAAAFVKQLYKAFQLSQEESIRVGAFLGQMGTSFQNAFNSGKNPTVPVESEQLPSYNEPTVRTKIEKKKKPVVMIASIAAAVLTAAGVSITLLKPQNTQQSTASEVAKIEQTSAPGPTVSPDGTSPDQGSEKREPATTTRDHTKAAEPLQKILLLNSMPSGSNVLVNNQNLGKTPLRYSWNDSTGTVATFRFEKAGYRATELKLTLDKALDPNVNAQLETQTVTRAVDSLPKAAKISINGKARGTAPLQFEFRPGQLYKIRAEAAGQEPLEIEYSEGRDSPSRLTLQLSPVTPPGTLKLDSLMPDLKMTVNGKPVSSTSIQLPPGELSIVLESEKVFYRETRKVQLASGQTLVLQTPLVLKIPKIEISNGFTNLRIDGRYVKKDKENDTTPITNLEIAAGSHTFEFVKPDGKGDVKIVASKQIEVTKSDSITVSADR